jgi:hypothetical protein
MAPSTAIGARPAVASLLGRAFGALVAAIVWPLPTRFGSPIVMDVADDAEPWRSRRARVFTIALVAFPLLFAGFAILLVADRARYAQVIAEDGPVEWATVAGLIVVAALAAVRAVRERRVAGAVPPTWMYAGLAVLCALVGLEEISWGQRIFGIENPAFFVRYSDQKETNIHNVVQKVTHVTMKWPIGLGFVGYGAVLPAWAAAVRVADAAGAATLARWRAVVPPLSLTRGLLLASVLMLDLPTNDEEEIGELFGVLALLLMLLSTPRAGR